jgi:hypothetical protein
VGTPNGVPIIGEARPVASLRVVMMSDDSSRMQLPPDNDTTWKIIGRIITAMLSSSTIELSPAQDQEKKEVADGGAVEPVPGA